MRRNEASGHRRRRISARTWDRHSQTVRRGFRGGMLRSHFRPRSRVEPEGGGETLLAREPRDNEFEEDPARGPGSPPIDAPSRGEFSGEFSRALPGPAAGGPCAAGGGWPALPNDGP